MSKFKLSKYYTYQNGEKAKFSGPRAEEFFQDLANTHQFSEVFNFMNRMGDWSGVISTNLVGPTYQAVDALTTRANDFGTVNDYLDLNDIFLDGVNYLENIMKNSQKMTPDKQAQFDEIRNKLFSKEYHEHGGKSQFIEPFVKYERNIVKDAYKELEASFGEHDVQVPDEIKQAFDDFIAVENNYFSENGPNVDTFMRQTHKAKTNLVESINHYVYGKKRNAILGNPTEPLDDTKGAIIDTFYSKLANSMSETDITTFQNNLGYSREGFNSNARYLFGLKKHLENNPSTYQYESGDDFDVPETEPRNFTVPKPEQAKITTPTEEVKEEVTAETPTNNRDVTPDKESKNDENPEDAEHPKVDQPPTEQPDENPTVQTPQAGQGAVTEEVEADAITAKTPDPQPQPDAYGRNEPYIGNGDKPVDGTPPVEEKKETGWTKFKNFFTGNKNGQEAQNGQRFTNKLGGGFLGSRLTQNTSGVASSIAKNTLGALAIGAIMTTAVALGGGGALAWGLTAAAIGVFKHLYDKNKKPDVAPETVQNSPAQAKPAETGYLQSKELYDTVVKHGAKVDQINQVNVVKEKELAELKDEVARLKGQDGNSPLQDKNGVSEIKEGVSKIKPNGNDKPDAPSKEQGSLTNDDNKSFNISYKDWANMSDIEIKKQLEIMDRLTNEALARNKQLTSDIEALKAEIEGIKQTVTSNATAEASFNVVDVAVGNGNQSTQVFSANSITNSIASAIGQGATDIMAARLDDNGNTWLYATAGDKPVVTGVKYEIDVKDVQENGNKPVQDTRVITPFKPK